MLIKQFSQTLMVQQLLYSDACGTQWIGAECRGNIRKISDLLQNKYTYIASSHKDTRKGYQMSMVGSLTRHHSLLYGCNNAPHTPPVDMPRVVRFSSTHSLSPRRFFLPLLHPSCAPSLPLLLLPSLFSPPLAGSFLPLLTPPHHSPFFFFFLSPSSLVPLFSSHPSLSLSPSVSARLCCAPRPFITSSLCSGHSFRPGATLGLVLSPSLSLAYLFSRLLK